jgi:hypothetical protein
MSPKLDTIQPMACNKTIAQLALLLCFCVNSLCFGQTITVRIVDLTSQRPVRNRPVYVFGISGKAETKEENIRAELDNPIAAELTLVTDIEGRSTFDLPKSVPRYFYVRAVLSGKHWDCFCAPRVSTEELEEKGIVVKNAEANAEPSIQPKPREILFALRPTPWWVRLFWPLLRG